MWAEVISTGCTESELGPSPRRLRGITNREEMEMNSFAKMGMCLASNEATQDGAGQLRGEWLGYRKG